MGVNLSKSIRMNNVACLAKIGRSFCPVPSRINNCLKAFRMYWLEIMDDRVQITGLRWIPNESSPLLSVVLVCSSLADPSSQSEPVNRAILYSTGNIVTSCVSLSLWLCKYNLRIIISHDNDKDIPDDDDEDLDEQLPPYPMIYLRQFWVSLNRGQGRRRS